MLELVPLRADAGIVLYDAVLIARRCCTREVAFYAATADDIPALRTADPLLFLTVGSPSAERNPLSAEDRAFSTL